MTTTSEANGHWPTAVGVLGLGIMGSSIARNLAAAGRQVLGYDPDAAQCENAAAGGVEIVDSARAAAEASDLLLTSLPSPQALDEDVTEICGVNPARLDSRFWTSPVFTMADHDRNLH